MAKSGTRSPDRKQRNTSPFAVFTDVLVMIVERLIKIHRYPIYLHYSLLQMWSFKLQKFFSYRWKFTDFSFPPPRAPICERFNGQGESNFKLSLRSGGKIILICDVHSHRLKRLRKPKTNCTPAICWRWYNREKLGQLFRVLWAVFYSCFICFSSKEETVAHKFCRCRCLLHFKIALNGRF